MRIPAPLFLLLAVSAPAAPLTLDEAVALAVSQSKSAQLARLKVAEASAGLDRAQKERYPTLSAFGMAAYVSDPYQVRLASGSLSPLLDSAAANLGLGSLGEAIGPFPSTDLTILEGNREVSIGGLVLLQPLTQQWRIGSGIDAARAAQSAALREQARVVTQTRFSVENIFARLLVEGRRRLALEERLASHDAQLRDAEHSQTVGELLDDAVLGLRAERTQAAAELARSDQQCHRLGLQLGDLVGRPGAAVLDLGDSMPDRAIHPLDYWLARVPRNPDLQVALALLEKAGAGVRAARQMDIPELALFAAGASQDGIGILPNNSGSVGVVLKWDILDFGRRHADIQKSLVQRREAEVERDRIEEEATREVRLAYQDLDYADQLVRLGEEAITYRQRSAQLARQSVDNGLALSSRALAAEADLRQADADLMDARIQRHLALLQLYLLTGEL
ncbi:MAG: TolC family protein [Opitutaceae bacterium]|jgi:outer membrane protein TolC